MATSHPRTHIRTHSGWGSWGSFTHSLIDSNAPAAQGNRHSRLDNHAGVKYKDGDTIDWFDEESRARRNVQKLRSGRGLRGFISLILNQTTLWFVVLTTGVGIGTIGGWLDILVAWLSDLRLGRCSYNLAYNQTTCCKGYDAGELCTEWTTWGQYLGIHMASLQALVQSFTYVALSVVFAGASAVLVKAYAPYAFHTGIPEIKAILGGFVFDQFLTPWVLLVKSVGLALSVASGLSLGKEGPLVHVACCIANLAARYFDRFRDNEVERRRMLAAAAAAGVSVAFGSPLGGVLFTLEELDVFHEEVMWRSFVTSAIAAVSLQYIDPFGTSKLVRFQVSGSNDAWRFFELVPWILLGVIGGLLGTLLIRLNVAFTSFRQSSSIKEWPVLEVLAMGGVTAAISHLVVFSRAPTFELVANLFLECDGVSSYHGLCNPNAHAENVFLLLITAMLKVVLTAWTFGIMVPAGIFLPTIAIGACVGRAFGLAVQSWHRLTPQNILFSACPPDPTVRCISPGFYAVIGAAGVLAGVTRMTISLVVIMFELTGALSHVLPIMIVVMTSKWVADSFGKEGIYTIWIALHQYPWLSPSEYKDSGVTCQSHMTAKAKLATIDWQSSTIGSLRELTTNVTYRGYPVVQEDILMGYISRTKLEEALVDINAADISHKCCFEYSEESPESQVDLSGLLETPSMNLRPEAPLELAVSIFQKMNIHYILFSKEGRLEGVMTRSDVMDLLTADIRERGILRPTAR